MYDEDYLYFFAAPGPSELAAHGSALPGADIRSDPAELVWRLLDLRPGMSVLDLACGQQAAEEQITIVRQAPPQPIGVIHQIRGIGQLIHTPTVNSER